MNQAVFIVFDLPTNHPLMSRLRVALFVDNPVLNLPDIALLAFDLCQQGATCFIIPFMRGHGEIFALAPDFVLLPAIGPYPFSLTLQFVAAGIQFGFAEVETPTGSSIYELMRALSTDVELAREMTSVYCWSPRVADSLISNGLVSRERVIVSGCPRFDYYVDPLLTAYRKKTSRSKPRRKTVILDTNFAIANPYYEERALAAGARYTSTEGLRSYASERIVKSLADLSRQIVGDFPETNIYFKSDLRELNEMLEQDSSHHPNMRLRPAGDIVSWVLQSAAVIHQRSTIAFDASLAQTPAISPQWIARTEHDPTADELSINCADYSAFRQSLGSALSGEMKASKQARDKAISIIENVFFKVDGLAHKRIATGILTSVRREIKPDLKKCRHYFSQLAGRSRLRRAGDTPKSEPVGLTSEARLNEPLSQRALERLVAAISEAKSAEKAKTVNISSANRGGAYINYKYRGRAIMMTCN